MIELDEKLSRISRMEQYYDIVCNAIYKERVLVSENRDIDELVEILKEYVESGLWMNDFESDERGELPRELKRGVLSEDGLYNLLSDAEQSGCVELGMHGLSTEDRNDDESYEQGGKMYKYILFDLDGTLTNPEIGITSCVMYSLEKFHIKVEDRKELHPFIGPPLMYSFQTYYGLSEEESALAVKYYRERFSVKGLYENEVYEGVDKLLQQLKESGKTIILATSKPEKFAVEILKYFDLYKYFDFVAGATMDGSRGEKADVIRYALEISGIEDVSQALMIGDRNYDILGAKEHGLDSLGVLFGFGDREELTTAGANYIVESVDEIAKYV